MRELPKYAFLTNPADLSGVKVISLERPYFIASIFELKVTEEDKIEDFMSAKAQGRYPVAKVPGYTIFLRAYSSLEPCNNQDLQQAILDEMAEFVLTERVQRKPGQFRMSDESGKSVKVHERAKEKAIRERRTRRGEE